MCTDNRRDTGVPLIQASQLQIGMRLSGPAFNHVWNVIDVTVEELVLHRQCDGKARTQRIWPLLPAANGRIRTYLYSDLYSDR